MSIRPAKCPNCGAKIMVETNKDARVCPVCNQPFFTEEAITALRTEDAILPDYYEPMVSVDIEEELDTDQLAGKKYSKLPKVIRDELKQEFRDCYCFAAVDLSQTTDLTNAKILLMKPNDNNKYIFSKYFIPESKLNDSNDKEAGAKYEEWARDTLCDVHEGNAIDLAKVAEWIDFESYFLRFMNGRGIMDTILAVDNFDKHYKMIDALYKEYEKTKCKI